MDNFLAQAVSSLGAAAPFAALAVYVIKWLMARIQERDVTIAAQNAQLVTLAQSYERALGELTNSIKSLGTH